MYGGETCKDCVAEAATVGPRDGATVGAVIIIMRMATVGRRGSRE